jgi:hypothetical protein
MSRNRKRLLTLGAVMLVVIIVIPVLASGAAAASKYKTLYKFSGGKDGESPDASLIFDQAGNLYGTRTPTRSRYFYPCADNFSEFSEPQSSR